MSGHLPPPIFVVFLVEPTTRPPISNEITTEARAGLVAYGPDFHAAPFPRYPPAD